MLETLRRGVRSWVVKVLLGLLVASFAVWGIGDIGAGFSTQVARVGDREIDANLFAANVRQQQQRFGLDPAQIRAAGLDGFVLGQMIRDAALEEAARRLGVSAPDSAVAREVRANPAFHVGGQFDATQYSRAVTRVFPSVAAFEEGLRRNIAASQIAVGALGGPAAMPGAATAIARFREEQRQFEVVTLPALTTPVPEPDEAALAAHLDRYQSRFAEPERRAVTWLHIDPAALAEEVDIADDEVRAVFDAQVAALGQPERRLIDQIVFDDLGAAEAALQRIITGATTFEGLLEEQGLRREDASLGRITRRELPGDRGDAAFALPEPGLVGPVRTPGGAALLEVRDIEAGGVPSFAAMAPMLRQQLKLDRLQPKLDRLAETVEDLRAGGATLEEAATDLGLTFGQTDALDRAGSSAERGTLMASRVFLDEAFTAAPGAERRILAAPDGGFFVVRVDDVTPSRVPPLETIRDAVAADWRQEAEREALVAEAQALADSLTAGGSLAALAEARGLAVSSVGPLRRGDPDPRLDGAARAALFAAEPGAAAVTRGALGVGVAVLTEVIDVAAGSGTVAELEAALAESLAVDQLEYLGRALEAQAGVSLNNSVLESVLSQIGG